MKKILALTLVTAMSLGVAASAASNITDVSSRNSATNDVKTTVKDFIEGEASYYVTVTFPSLEFTYNMGTLSEWQQDVLKYNTPSDQGWEAGTKSGQITVSNRSNRAISLDCQYKASGSHQLAGKITGGAAKLESAVSLENPLTAGAATDTTFTFEITETPSEDFEQETVGTITLTVTASEAV